MEKKTDIKRKRVKKEKRSKGRWEEGRKKHFKNKYTSINITLGLKTITKIKIKSISIYPMKNRNEEKGKRKS